MNDDIFTRFFNSQNSRFHNDFKSMFDEMDQMMSRFNHGQFNMIDDSQANNDERSGNLRDKFLKSSNESDDKQSQMVPSVQQPSIFQHFFDFDPFNNRHQANEVPFEEDLDKKIAREGLDKVFREDINRKKNDMFPQNFRFQSFGQSSSVRRIQRPDGTIEEIKTVKNSDGKEVKTVTRIIGDKVHSVVEKKNKHSIEETEEYFQNFDQDKIEDFNKEWHGNNLPSHPALKNEIKKPESLISRLFSWLR